MRMRTYLTIVALMASTMTFAASIHTKLFVFGFVSSFNDSTVYFTEIQQMDSAWVDKKTGFLYSRDNYSYQLREYMKGMGIEHPTCVTSYSPKRKDIEKKYTSMRKKYSGNKGYTIKYITANEFQYNPIAPDQSESEEVAKPKKKEKKQHKQKVPKPKDFKPGVGPGSQMPPGGVPGQKPNFAK